MAIFVGPSMWNAKGVGSENRNYYSSFSKLRLGPTVNLLTRTSKPSLDTSAGRLTAGANAEPSSSDTNWTRIFPTGFLGSGSGSGTPWYVFCRLGGGRRVAIVGVVEKKSISRTGMPDLATCILVK
jgi:hypothetical protein